MRRRTAVIGALSGAALAGGLLLAPTAHADHVEDCNGLNYDVDVFVNGDAVIDEHGCLSPDSGGAPELPPLEPPAPPAL